MRQMCERCVGAGFVRGLTSKKTSAYEFCKPCDGKGFVEVEDEAPEALGRERVEYEEPEKPRP